MANIPKAKATAVKARAKAKEKVAMVDLAQHLSCSRDAGLGA